MEYFFSFMWASFRKRVPASCWSRVSFVVQFVEKAPENIVRGVREKASEAEEKISLTKNRLTFLQSTVST